MAKYASGDNIPVVGIQPSASPVAINVLPAAGQPTRGSQLQQIAESLAPFNQGLMSFGTAMVKQDAERAQQMGENLDFGGVSGGLDKIAPELRGAELNKRFKSIIETSGGSDASNPYFQIAAQQNYGRTLGLDYRSAIYGMKEQLTDPEHPMAYGDASAQAAESVLGDSLKDNFYAFSGFRDVASKTDQEMQRRFQEERTQRMETLGGMRVQEVMGKAIAAEDPILLSAAWADYQKTVTDPAKVKATYITAARSSLHAAPDADSLVKSFEMLAGMQYGNTTVHDNMPLYADLVLNRDQAESAMMTKLQQQTIMGNIAEKKAMEQMSGEGIETNVLNHAASDHFTTESVSDYAKKHVDEMAKKFGWSPATKDKMFGNVNDMANKALASVLQSQNVHDALNDKAIEKRLIPIIMAGNGSADMIMSSGLSTNGQLAMMEMNGKFTNSTVAAKATALDAAQSISSGVLSQVLSDAYPDVTGTGTSMTGKMVAVDMAASMQQRVVQHVDSYIRGEVKDASGKTYDQYKALSPAEAASSVKGYTEMVSREMLKEAVDQTKINISAGKVYKNGAWVAKADDAKNADMYLSTSDQRAKAALDISVGGVGSDKKVEESMRPVYTELTNIAYDFDHGWTNSTELESLESRGAQLWYQSKTNLLTKGTDRIVTNDSKIRTYTGVTPMFEAFGWLTDGYEVKKTLPEISEAYGKIKRARGLTLSEVLHDTDSNGIPISGVSIPLGREQRQKAAFNILMIQHQDELADSASVDGVLEKLGLTQNEKARFIQVQLALLGLHKTAYDRMADKFTFGTYTKREVKEASGIFQRTLEQHQARQNTKP
jgi:hypothetical protein